ncbi:hypothetical protein EHLJMEHL_00982 [Vreelandella titanicae]
MPFRIKYLWLPLIFLLAGCDNEFATLEFNDRVNKTDNTLSQNYRDELTALISEQGINPEDIKIETHSNNNESIVLKAPFFRKPDDNQMAALRDALQDIIDNKDTTLEVTFTILTDDLNDLSPEDKEIIETLEQEYTVDLEFKEPLIVVGQSFGDSLQAAFSQDGRTQSNASCSMVMTVEPALPFQELKLRGGSEDELEYIFIKNVRGGYITHSVPVEITTRNQQLQEALENFDVAILTNIRSGELRRELGNARDGIQQLELDLGPMGTVRHENGAVSSSQMWSLKNKCGNISLPYGRPFTYEYGESLDRLESVSFD